MPNSIEMSKQGIFFDAVGTLIYPDPPVFTIYHAIGKRHGSSLSIDEIALRFTAAYTKYFTGEKSGNLCTSEAQEKQRWQAVVEHIFGLDISVNTGLFNELWSHFSVAEHWKVYADIRPVFESLINNSIYVGIASNFDARLVHICSQHFPNISTEHIFYSTELGYSKPHIQFYKSIEQHFSDPQLEFTMVGDDYDNDIVGAQNAGWKAIHRNDFANALNPS